MRYLPLLLLAGCIFDTRGMPDDADRIDIYDGRGAIGVLGDADGGGASLDGDVGDDAAVNDAAVADGNDVGEAEDAAADAGPESAANPDAAADAAPAPGVDSGPASDAAPPALVAVCGRCEDSLECADGLSCRYSSALIGGKTCLPDIPTDGTCAEMCPGLPVPNNGVCNPAPSATGACGCD